MGAHHGDSNEILQTRIFPWIWFGFSSLFTKTNVIHTLALAIQFSPTFLFIQNFHQFKQEMRQGFPFSYLKKF